MTDKTLDNFDPPSGDEGLKEVCVASATVHRGKFLTLKQDIVRLPTASRRAASMWCTPARS